jgi:hypothetical protein
LLESIFDPEDEGSTALFEILFFVHRKPADWQSELNYTFMGVFTYFFLLVRYE